MGGQRPADLNDRQRLHANIAKAVLTVVPGVDWLFHVDADEICQIDRAAIRKAAAWVVNTTRETPQEQLLGEYTFFSHVGNALALWRKTRPAEAWERLAAGGKLE